MSLLEDVQNAAIDTNSDLGEVLRKCKVLAARLDSKPLEDWLVWESNGYPSEVELPEYRAWSIQLKGNFSGMFQSALNNAPIPTMCVPKDFRDAATVYHCRQSVASIGDLLQENDSGTFQISVGDLSLVLSTKVYEDMNCLQAWGEFGRANLVEVLNAVRNRILDFVLAIWKEDPEAGEVPGSADRLQPSKVGQIFNTTVYGGAANLVGSAEGSTITFNVQTGDFETLAQALRNHGVDDADIEELRTAVQADPQAEDSNALGPRVSGWIAKMTGKAASGAWQLGIGAAAALLADMIAKYYGLAP